MSKFLSLMLVLLTAMGLLILFIWVLPAQGTIPATAMADIVVNTLDDEDNTDGDCSLREAIHAANENVGVDACPVGDVLTDTITFSVSGTITLTEQLLVTAGGPLVIDGAEAITISGGDSVRIFYVNTGAELTLVGMVLTEGNAGVANGGGIYNLGSLILNNSTISGNVATGEYESSGGGIYNNDLMTITNGTLSGNSSTNGGSIYNDLSGSLTIANSNLSGNDSMYGGGIYNIGVLTVSNSTLSGNDADESGGGIYMQDGSLVLTSSILSGNNTEWEGGGGIFSSAGAVVTIHDSMLSSNDADVYGGGIFNIGTMTITHSTLSENKSLANVSQEYGVPNDAHRNLPGSSSRLLFSAGGGIYNSGLMTILESSLSSNSAVGDQSEGGGIINGGTVFITGSILSGNDAGWSGGINNGGHMTIIDSTISGNSATDHMGGGIFNVGTLTVTNSTVSNNFAEDSCGGIHNKGLLVLNTSTLSGNYAGGVYGPTGSGGGICNFDDLTIINSTLSGNTAAGNEGHGGGIENGGTLILSFSTLSGNSASLDGGGIHNGSGIGESTLDNSIVANNLSGGNCAGTPITDAGHNIEDTDTCGFDPANGSLPNTDPLLAPLQDNGGPTWTHAFSPVSPAIDAADPTACPPTDQRGVPRPVDGDGDGEAGCDIGSIELDQWIILDPALQSNSAAPGDTLVYTINLTNDTDSTDMYTLDLGAHAWETALSTETIGPLAGGESQPFTISVTIPVTAAWYMTDTAVITAASVTSPTLYWDTAQVTTQAYAPPQISVSPTELNSTQWADQVVTLPLTISNGLGVTLTFSISTSEVTPWLSVDPDSGTVDTNSSAQVQITLDSTGLSPGVYTSTLVIESNDPDTPSVPIPVTMTVQAPPQISITPTALNSTQVVDQIVTLALTISNGNGVTLTYAITTTEATPWLSVDPVSGSVETNSTDQVQVTLDATGISPGVYTATLVVESNDPDVPSLHIPVTMTVQESSVKVYLPFVTKKD